MQESDLQQYMAFDRAIEPIGGPHLAGAVGRMIAWQRIAAGEKSVDLESCIPYYRPPRKRQSTRDMKAALQQARDAAEVEARHQ